MAMRTIQALVIGGGPSGLAIAYALKGSTLLLEREASVGGLCRSVTHDGGVFDIGGHSFHTPHADVYELVQALMNGDLYLQPREARIFTHDVLIPYPFQKNFARIPDADVVRACEEGLRQAEGDPAGAADFQEYILRKFGSGIAEHFMLPYNRKLWARDLKRMSCEWTSERVAAPKGGKEEFDLVGGKRTPLQADTVVGYPSRGGYEEIYRSFVPHLSAIELNTEIVSIDPHARTATSSDGRQFGWQFLVATIPLPVLLRIVEGVPPEVVALADRLEYMSLRVELLLAGRRIASPIQRIYVAAPDIPPHKIALNHNSSDYLRRQPHSAIMAEVSLSKEKELVNVEEIASKSIDFLCRVGILDSPADIIWQGHMNVNYAYPVYTHERPMLVKSIKDWMAQYDIHTLGRFGDWEYINSDRCIAKGLALAGELRRRYGGQDSR